jgi:hypothetical protein
MWTAYWQADGDLRYEIAVTKFKHTAEFERDEFVKRMSKPEVGTWFTWVEDDETFDDNPVNAFGDPFPWSEL